MKMGWVAAGHIKLYNFQGSGGIVERITLHAAELGDTPMGRFKGIELRRGDGHNYYVEYRREQPGFISDDIPDAGLVLVTDVISEDFRTPYARPWVLFAPDDADGDGHLIDNGQNLRDTDPGTGMDLEILVESTDLDHATVRVSYGSNGRPEPGIRPWGAEASHWQSPDVEVRNDRATADPEHNFNVPWLGHDNTIVAKVRNNGDLLATGVKVDFFVTEYTTGDGPPLLLGFETNNIAPGGVVEFSKPWNPPATTDGHFCIIVRIRLYRDPANPAIFDHHIYNNEARSNYTRFVSESASRSSRMNTTIQIANPFSAPTHVYTDVTQTHHYHRVFTEHQWMRVAGEFQRPVRIWDETIWDTDEWKRRDDRDPKSDCGTPMLTGGVGIRVDAARATSTDVERASTEVIDGEVSFIQDGSLVVGTDAKLLLELILERGGSSIKTVSLGSDGKFQYMPGGLAMSHVVVYFLGAYSAAPSETGKVKLLKS
ncbi:hypothetical protein BJY01DRAFT_248845 [Aspergillus pseudoustus]|uniref:CARDB domain-containing protein n=1 Tax=Aspergillus pseudoustus TaxID=1810923 RepID=A0ABR4JS75_9EURO